MKQIHHFFTILLLAVFAENSIAATYYKGSTIKSKTTEGVEMSFTVIDPDAKTCKVSSYCVNENTSGKITIPSYVEGFKVIEINNSAFSSCNKITAIEIPYTVEVIGEDVFWKCEALKEINIPGNVTSIGEYAFYECKNLASVTIPSKVTVIPRNMFYKCESLSSVSLPKGITEIGNYAFAYCNAIESVSLPENVKKIGQYCFEYCSKIISFEGGKSLEEIGYEAFYRCEQLKTVALPSTVKVIDDYVFYGCSALTTITGIANVEKLGRYTFYDTPWFDNLPKGMIYIGKVAFKYNVPSSMPENTEISIKEGTTCITDGAFSGCFNMASVSIPGSVTSIGIDAFARCTSLTSIKVASTNKYYDSRDNCNAVIHTASNTLISGCNSTIIPKTVTVLGYDAFMGCSFTTMNIPDNVDSLANDVFWTCI